MKYCTNCGTQCDDNAKFCTNCGSQFQSGEETYSDSPYISQPAADDSYHGAESSNYDSGDYYGGGNSSGIEPRNIVVCVILSIVTCGIYNIYWMIKLNDEVNQLAGESGATSGGMVFLFSLLTCGIYGIYWNYKMGERCDRINHESGSTPILFLILALLSLSIVNYCLMQDTINTAL